MTEAVLDAPLDTVFGWHERPGALMRLVPPWQPVRVLREAGSLRDGRAVLGLLGGLRWVAQHGGYDSPHRFVDELVSWPLAPLLRWRHVHEFRVETPSATRVIDAADTTVPGGLLQATFAFRQRQLAEDFAVHRAMAALRAEPMTVGVTGASGLVGTALVALLTIGGHTLVQLVRRPARNVMERQWDPGRPAAGLSDGLDALVHLAGASVAGRFTEAHKGAVRVSRLGPTRALAELAAASGLRCWRARPRSVTTARTAATSR